MFKRKLPPWLALLALFLFAALPARAQGESLPELIRRVKPSVVSVITYNAKGEVTLTGSGFFVRPGQVLTNLHVVEGAHHAEVRTFEGKGKTYTVAGLTNVDEDGDLAVLSVEMPLDRASVVETAAAAPGTRCGSKARWPTASSRPYARCRVWVASCRSPRPSRTATRAAPSST
jgi:S1-C subfamily serine protease